MSRIARVHLEERECCKCGSDNTYEVGFNRILWYRDVDEHGKWTGKWVCSRCYNRMKSRERNEERKRAIMLKRALIKCDDV